ncbi:hypothetical protein, partial [Pseudoalteromonas sp.]|uniref:hypothetical protein n=1 Tax=Pseudoalteromonas sp. TaxID=53249 RepID=UPI00261DE29B
VNRYSYPDSRVSIKVHSVIILTQLIRFARIITQYHEFMLKCKQLFQIMSERNFSRDFLISQLLRFCTSNTVLLLRYFVPTKAAIAKFTIDVFRNI